LAAKETLPFNF